jgi:hypothetical protein
LEGISYFPVPGVEKKKITGTPGYQNIDRSPIYFESDTCCLGSNKRRTQIHPSCYTGFTAVTSGHHRRARVTTGGGSTVPVHPRGRGSARRVARRDGISSTCSARAGRADYVRPIVPPDHDAPSWSGATATAALVLGESALWERALGEPFRARADPPPAPGGAELVPATGAGLSLIGAIRTTLTTFTTCARRGLSCGLQSQFPAGSLYSIWVFPNENDRPARK